MDDTKYWVAFSRISNIGRVRFERLERYFGSLRSRLGSRQRRTARGWDRGAAGCVDRLTAANNRARG